MTGLSIEALHGKCELRFPGKKREKLTMFDADALVTETRSQCLIPVENAEIERGLHRCHIEYVQEKWIPVFRPDIRQNKDLSVKTKKYSVQAIYFNRKDSRYRCKAFNTVRKP
jgi:hypothetical protein